MISIVALDGHTLNPGDLSWQGIEALGHFEFYPHSTPAKIVPRAKTADILIVNKCVLDRSTLEQLPQLKYICVSATGFNNIDLTFCKERKIPVSNVSGYGTSAVAQHVFALLLTMTNHVSSHNQGVHLGGWSKQVYFSYWNFSLQEISGKVMGIYGFGKIGQAVGKIALAFGMKVIAHHKHPTRDQMDGVEFVDLDTLFAQSDVLTLHAPLTATNQEIVSATNLKKMKSSAYLINTGRGGLIHERDLKTALENNWIAGAGLDVLAQEPPPPDHVLFGVKNCIITPHQAWASQAARQRLMNEIEKNIKGYLTGKMKNLIG
ncbi:MAG: D-2-hydroxyacid dehydrogenase [Bacteroidota bacterium]